MAAVVEALNTVRKNNGNNTLLTMDAEVCAMAEKMAKIAAGLAAWQVRHRPEWQAVYEGLERHQPAAGKG